ncbi:hypothetical protein ABK040_012285 [Willaertia magna]
MKKEINIGYINILAKEVIELLKQINNNKLDKFTWNVIITSLCFDKENIKEAFKIIDNILYPIEENEISKEINKFNNDGSGLLSDITLTNLISACQEFGYINEAIQLFNDMPNRFKIKPNIYHYGNIIKLLVCENRLEEALQKYTELKSNEINYVIYLHLIYGCTNSRQLQIGKELHKDILTSDCSNDIKLKNALINMYAKCGDIESASILFEDMRKHNLLKDVVTWTSMIDGYRKSGQGEKALKLFDELMKEQEKQTLNIKPNATTFLVALNACAECGIASKAIEIIDSMERVYGIRPEIEHYGVLSKALARANSIKDGIKVLVGLEKKGVKTNHVFYTTLISGCTKAREIKFGMQLHERLEMNGIEKTIELMNALINMYIKIGYVDKANAIFKELVKEGRADTVSYNTMLSGFIHLDRRDKVLPLYKSMKESGIPLDRTTYGMVMNVCVSKQLIEEGYEICNEMFSLNMEPAIERYFKLVEALHKNGYEEQANELIEKMNVRKKIIPLFIDRNGKYKFKVIQPIEEDKHSFHKQTTI